MSGEEKRLESNKNETGKLLVEIQDLGDGCTLAAFALDSATESMAKSISWNHSKTEIEDGIDKKSFQSWTRFFISEIRFVEYSWKNWLFYQFVCA